MGRVETNVTLLAATPESQELVASAGKLCCTHDVGDIFNSGSSDSAQFVHRLMRMGHTSPLEHAVFTFYIEGVSRAMTHQLVRHRLASYSQRSQRYVDHSGFDYIVPPELEGRTVDVEGGPVDAVVYFEQTMQMIAERYARLRETLGREGEKGNEDARYALPNACETKIVVTMNARELLHFFEERLCLRAQWEIRSAAGEMLKLVKGVCPAVFAKAGPKCIRLGGCPEGPKSCGQVEQIRRQYASDNERESKREREDSKQSESATCLKTES